MTLSLVMLPAITEVAAVVVPAEAVVEQIGEDGEDAESVGSGFVSDETSNDSLLRELGQVDGSCDESPGLLPAGEKVETVKSLPKNQVLPLLLLILLAAVARAVAAQVRPAPHLMVALTISQAQP